MHRDNPDVPVGEFVDAMDAEVQGGPHPRPVRRLELDAAAHGRGDRLCRSAPARQKPGALSNNFSLAEMLEPIWAGCVASSDDDWKAWLTSTADAELRLVEPGPRLLHRPRRARQARQ